MKWTEKEEELAKKEYLQMIGTLKNSDEFKHEWSGEWDDFIKNSFGQKSKKVKGDKHKFMKHWLEDQDVINDVDWNKIEEDDNF